jgi:NAD(P)-dependent dehydrogenase (short-subunit alcohol dehydrogenase family)
VQSLFDLTGRIAFVSGGRGHLGAIMCQALAEAGAHVIVNGRDAAKLAAFAGSLKEQGLSAEPAAFDIGDIGAVRAFFAGRSRLDILVNNAVTMQVKAFDALEPADFAATYTSSVTASFEAARAALPALERAVAERGDASIVNIASMYGQVAPDARLYDRTSQQSPFHYGPAKAALLQLSRHLAAELGPRRIRVNALVPGPFPREVEAEFGKRLAARTLLGRLGRKEEIAGPLLFLASPASSFITGSALSVDGGWTAW